MSRTPTAPAASAPPRLAKAKVASVSDPGSRYVLGTIIAARDQVRRNHARGGDDRLGGDEPPGDADGRDAGHDEIGGAEAAQTATDGEREDEP